MMVKKLFLSREGIKFSLTSVIAGFAITLMAGCTEANLFVLTRTNSNPIEQAREGKNKLSPGRSLNYMSLSPGSRLANIAQRVDTLATSRSAAIEELRAAEAELTVRKFDRLPQVRPIAEAEVTGDQDLTVGLVVEQTIWDGGQHKARINTAETNIARAQLLAWIERSNTVLEGSSAFVEISRFNKRIMVYKKLQREIQQFQKLLDLRLSGGVSDRGELLRLSVAAQGVQRKIFSDTSSFRNELSVLQRLVPDGTNLSMLIDLTKVKQVCRRNWPSSEAPIDAVARMNVYLAEAEERLVKAQRFPRVIVGLGADFASDTSTDPNLGFRLDTANLLGIGRKANLDAASAATRSAVASYNLQKLDTISRATQLDAEIVEIETELTQLKNLLTENQKTLKLYKEQVEIGSIPLTEGIELYEEISDTEISIIDRQADALLNCIEASDLRGHLVPFKGRKNEG